MTAIAQGTDAKNITGDAGWTPRSRFIIGICMLANIADGIDGMAAALVGPHLVRLWGLSAGELGMLLAATPLGMIAGTILLSPLADRFGRRTVTLACQIILLTGMFASAMSPNVHVLALLRVITGIGIGCTITMVNLMGAEHAPRSKRTMAMLLISCGGPIGFLLGGLAAIPLLHYFSWQSVFIAGAMVGLVVFVLIVLFLPETPEYLRVRAARGDTTEKVPVRDLLRGPVFMGTLLLTLAFTAVSMSSHFLQLWTPVSLVNAGLSVSSGISGSVLLSSGMVIGMIIFAFIANRWGIRRMGVGVMVLAFVAACAFAVVPMKLTILLPLAFLAGAFLAPAAGTTFAMIALVFPTRVRATGTAIVVGGGKLGAMLGPVIAGVLVDAGLNRTAYSIILAAPFLIAAVSLAFTPSNERE